MNWVSGLKSDLIFKESALAIETNDITCQKLLVIMAPSDLRIDRALKRNPELMKSSVVSRMKNQTADSHRMLAADYLINNDGSLEDLYAQIDEFLVKMS
jgi:dephospho-CoA kinase